jgi:hypothetical protein
MQKEHRLKRNTLGSNATGLAQTQAKQLPMSLLTDYVSVHHHSARKATKALRVIDFLSLSYGFAFPIASALLCGSVYVRFSTISQSHSRNPWLLSQPQQLLP